jgi:hypothetical protein
MQIFNLSFQTIADHAHITAFKVLLSDAFAGGASFVLTGKAATV